MKIWAFEKAHIVNKDTYGPTVLLSNCVLDARDAKRFPVQLKIFDLDTDANIYIPHKNRNLVLKLLAAPPSNDE